MSQWFDYLCSDYDERAHKGAIHLDLTAIDAVDSSFDIILTPHVLEHVRDVDKALNEIFRVLRPGGTVYLQVPLLQGRTAPPSEPEFHGDDTPVFWRFGFDLTARLRGVGFHTTLLTTKEFREYLSTNTASWSTPHSPEFDLASMAEHADPSDMTALADESLCTQLSFIPGYMFFTWEARKPG